MVIYRVFDRWGIEAHVFYLGTDVSTQLTYDACIVTNLALNSDFTTLEICAINWRRM